MNEKEKALAELLGLVTGHFLAVVIHAWMCKVCWNDLLVPSVSSVEPIDYWHALILVLTIKWFLDTARSCGMDSK